MLRELAYRLLYIDVEKDGNLAVNHIRVARLEHFLQGEHYRLIDAVKQVAFIGEDHDHAVKRVRSLRDLVDPTRYILYVMLVRQVAHDYEPMLVPIELLYCAFYQMAFSIELYPKQEPKKA